MPIDPRKCAECGTPFVPRMKKHICCSVSCSGAYRRKQPENREDAKRRTREWVANNKERVRAYYASKHKPIRTENCKQCGTAFQTKNGQKFCSISCRGKYRRLTKPEWYRESHSRNKEKVNARSRNYSRNRRAVQPWKPLIEMAKVRARQKGLPCDLTDAWAISRWNANCEVTGIPFKLGCTIRDILSPSLDQIEPKKGYTQSNTRFVVWGYNALKGSGTDLDAARIAAALLTNHGFTLIPPVRVAPTTPPRSRRVSD